MPDSTITLIAAKLREGVVGGGVTLEQVAALPAGLSPPPGQVKAYYRITPLGFENVDIVLSEVQFLVSKGWLEANDVNPLAVQFSRYSEERRVWVPLVAKWQAEVGEQFQYLVNPSAFSLWAITGTATVPPPRFLVDNLTIETAFGGEVERVLIVATVTNLTAEGTDFNAILWLDDQAEETQTLALGPGDTKLITFTIDLSPGSHTVRVDRLVRTITIEAPPPTPTPVPTATAVPTRPAVPTPTATPAPTVTPRPTPSSVLPTPTGVLPTPTLRPTPTVTEVPPTATLAPTATATPAPTSTPVPPVEEEDEGLPDWGIIVIAVVVMVLGAAALAPYLVVLMRRR